jgi:lysyl-tRNA synthetase class 2
MESTNIETPAQEEKKEEVKLYLDEPTGEMVSKSELKKRQKNREKEVKALAKAEEKKIKEAEKPIKAAKPTGFDEVELDPSKYTENRKNWIQQQRDQGKNPYPHKFSRTHRIDQFRSEFDAKITENVFLEDEVVSVTGRIVNIRAQGVKLIFIDIEGDSKKLQIMATATNY